LNGFNGYSERAHAIAITADAIAENPPVHARASERLAGAGVFRIIAAALWDTGKVRLLGNGPEPSRR
jgi:16S rRNA G1207 methylase RsmC